MTSYISRDWHPEFTCHLVNRRIEEKIGCWETVWRVLPSPRLREAATTFPVILVVVFQGPLLAHLQLILHI